jgi:hypothetical protein
VFQERFLSRRVLHFTQTQVYWECCEDYANELYPAGFRKKTTKRGARPVARCGRKLSFFDMIDNLNKPRSLPFVTQKFLPEARRYMFWKEIISWYTQKSLTFHSDRLPALSGIAKHLASIVGSSTSQYLAGIWRDPLMIAQLAWYTHSPSTPFSVPPSGTPTWSWAITNQPVVFSPFLENNASVNKVVVRSLPGEWIGRTCSIIEARTTLATEDPTGPVRNGYLLVRGHMNRISLGADERYYVGGTRVDIKLYFDRPSDHDSGDKFLLSLFEYHLSYENWPYDKGVLCTTFLILSPLQGQGGTYERCGLATSYKQSNERGLALTGDIWKSITHHDVAFEAPLDPEHGFEIRIV